MKFRVVGCLVSLLLPLSAFAALPAGSAAPDFRTQASLAGQPFNYSLQNALKKGPVVVYFFPSAYTQGCDLEAHTFAENYDKFTAAGASIIGVSLDSIKRLNAFSADPDYCASKVAVASDPKGAIARSYDLPVRAAVAGMKDTRGVDIDHGFTSRTTFIVLPNGTISATIDGASPVQNVARALEVVQKLHVTQN